MGRGENQKLKLYYLMQILLEKTDAEHYISMKQIIEKLDEYGIPAERKSIYKDIEELEKFGIIVESNKVKGYHVISRKFDIAELKLLVDAVSSSKFVTEEKTRELIQKLTGFASEYERLQLNRQTYVTGRIKAFNEEIFNAVDIIHNSINNNHKITFQYYNWNEKKEIVVRHGGEYYLVSPIALTWDDENYYLIAYDDKMNKIKHYRVDKMLNLRETDDRREGKEYIEKFNLAKYAKMNFSMFGGEEKDVQLEFDNSFAGVMIDRFGKDIIIRPDMKNTGKSITWVRVALSKQFIAWVFSLGENVKIIGPQNVVDIAKNEVLRLMQQYNC